MSTVDELPPEAELRLAIKELLKDADLQTTTTRSVRAHLQEKFTLSPSLMSREDTKKLIRSLLLDELSTHTPEEPNVQAEEEENASLTDDPEPASKPQPIVKKTARPKSSIKRKHTDASKAESKPSPRTTLSSQSEKNSNSESEAHPIVKRTKKSGTKGEDGAPDKPEKASSSADKVEKLKRYVWLCGVVKPYAKMFAGMSVKQQIKALQELLAELGVEGTPSLKKCKEVRLAREEQRELAELNTENILTGPRRRTALESGLQDGTPSRSEAAPSDDDSDRPRKKLIKEPDLSFLAESPEPMKSPQSPEASKPVVVGDAKLAADIFSDDD